MADLITRARALYQIPDVDECDYLLVDTLITAASKIIENYTHRTFISATYSERYDGDGRSTLFLDNYPIASMDWVATARSNCLEITNTDTTTNQRATVAATSTGLRLITVASGTQTTDTSVTWASNATVTAVATAVNALGSGWSATVKGDFANWPSNEIYAGQGGKSVINNGVARNVYLQIFDEFLEDVDVIDPDTGEIGRNGAYSTTYDQPRFGTFPHGKQNISVKYTAGYAQASLPADLQQATAELVSMMFAEATTEGGNNTGMKSEDLGDYSYERFENPSTWPKRTLHVLNSYRSYKF